MNDFRDVSPSSVTTQAAIIQPIVVGIAVAGKGLEAAQAFLKALPADENLILIVVDFGRHRDGRPLLQALRAASPLPVIEAGDGIVLEPNRIYAAPPGTLPRASGAALRVTSAEPPESRPPIDRFFHALADDHRDKAVALICSDEAGDGALGLKAITRAGGLTLAPIPEPGAESNGAADCVGPPEVLAAELLAHVRHRRTIGLQASRLRRELGEELPLISQILLQASGQDFKHYKVNTLLRRTLRRVQVLRLDSAQAYVERLRAEPAEVKELFHDLLIGVTAFFRDPDAFAALAKEVLPALPADRSAGDTVRIWVPGCSTGEEAYSLAMLVQEQLDSNAAPPGVQIFATDIDEGALATARRGVYSSSAVVPLSPERLARFFVKKGHRYQVTKALRERVLFSAHNLIADPPFSRLDLISCRNLLIYLGNHLQKRLIPLFHFALKPNGYLFLGPSETLTTHADLFRPVNVKYRISQRLPTHAPAPGLAVAALDGLPASHYPSRIAAAPPVADPSEAYGLMQRIVLEEFSPKTVVVNGDGRVICTSGSLEKYLTLGAGSFHNSLFRLVREGLRIGLRGALSEAKKCHRRVVRDGLSVGVEGGVQRVMLTVQPMPQLGEEAELYLVAFQDAGLPMPRRKDAGPLGDESVSALVEQLERELGSTRADLEKTVQDLEAANEELKSGNEELLSMNEELQSSNEELETSKEDLQEALDDLAQSKSDLENLFANTRIATLFLDDDGRIRRITPAAGDIYHVTAADVGRPIGHFSHRMRFMPPLPDAMTACHAPRPLEDEVESLDETWYLRRVLPYINPEGEPEGIVVTFTDITERKRAEAAVRGAQTLAEQRLAHLDAVYASAPVGLCFLNADLRYERINDRLAAMNGLPAAEHRGRRVREVLPELGPWLETLYRRVLDSGVALEKVEVQGTTPAQPGVERIWEMSYHPFAAPDGEIAGLNVVVEDITERKQIEETLKRQAESIELSFEPMLAWDLDDGITEWNRGCEQLYGYSAAEALGQTSHQLLQTRFPMPFGDIQARLLSEGTWTGELQHTARDGRAVEVECRLQLTGRRVLETNRDITGRKQAESALRDSEERFRALAELSPDALLVHVDGRYVYANPAAARLLGVEDHQAIIGYPVYSVIPAEFHGLVQERVATMLEKNQAVPSVEYLWRRIDGSLVDVDVAAAPVLWRGRRAIQVVARDITGRKQVEAALRDSEARYRAFTQSVPSMTFEGDAAGGNTFVSEQWCDYTGMTPEQSAGNGWIAAVHPDDLPVSGQRWAEAVAGGTFCEMRHRLRGAQGQYRWFLVRSLPMRDPEGRVLRWVGSCTDIEDMVRAEQALRDSQAELRLVTDHAPVVLAHFDAKLRFVFANRAYAERFGLSPSDCIGRTVAQVIGESAFERFKPYIERVLTGEAVEFELDVPYRVLGRRYMHCAYAPDRDGEGRILGFVAALVDVTDRRRMEEALKASEKALRAADRRKDEFLAMLGHELRNPLAPVRNAVAILKRAGQIDPHAERARDMIDRQVTHLARLVDDLLDTTRIARGQVRLQKERCDFAAIAQQTAEDYRSVLEAGGLDLTVDCPPFPLWVEGDPTRLSQMLGNLLHNARKFTDRGGRIALRVRLEEPAAGGEGPSAVLCVRDSGIGIEADMLSRVFEIFAQADQSLDRSRGGLGLGLALVKGLVELHGGRVEARSDGAGRGAEFCVSLPLCEAAAWPENRPAAE